MYAISRTSTLNFQNQLLVYEILLQLVEREQIIIACTQNPNHVKWFCDGIGSEERHGFMPEYCKRHVAV